MRFGSYFFFLASIFSFIFELLRYFPQSQEVLSCPKRGLPSRKRCSFLQQNTRQRAHISLRTRSGAVPEPFRTVPHAGNARKWAVPGPFRSRSYGFPTFPTFRMTTRATCSGRRVSATHGRCKHCMCESSPGLPKGRWSCQETDLSRSLNCSPRAPPAPGVACQKVLTDAKQHARIIAGPPDGQMRFSTHRPEQVVKVLTSCPRRRPSPLSHIAQSPLTAGPSGTRGGAPW